jgi:hypothetical protein
MSHQTQRSSIFIQILQTLGSGWQIVLLLQVVDGTADNTTRTASSRQLARG